eukprot:Polyplicarium_translucidae@DN1656_c0_g1_i1.p4
MIGENQRIAIGLLTASGITGSLAALMLFDRMLVVLSNVTFLLGVGFLIGPRKMLRFFGKRDKLSGTTFYMTGFVLVLFRWVKIGLLLEAWGAWALFSAFLPNVLAWVRISPVGFLLELPGVKQLARWINDRRTLPY